MKMKKIIAAVMTALMSVSLMGMTAFAAQSPTTTGITESTMATTDANGNEVALTISTPADAAAWEEIGIPAEAAQTVADINAGILTGAEALKAVLGDDLTAVETVTGEKVDVSKATVITTFADIKAPENAVFPLDVTISSASVKDKDVKNVFFLHITKEGKIQLIPAEKIDGTNVTGKFDSLSPVALIYAGADAATVTGTATATGDNAQPLILAIIAALSAAVIVGIVLSRRKKKM